MSVTPFRPASTLPGVKARHAVISDACRTAHGGDLQAFTEAVALLRDEFIKLTTHWKKGRQVKFHLALSVEYPAKKEGDS